MFAPVHQISDGRYISPTHYVCKGSRPSRVMKCGLLNFKEASPINSGIMVNVTAFMKQDVMTRKLFWIFLTYGLWKSLGNYILHFIQSKKLSVCRIFPLKKGMLIN